MRVAAVLISIEALSDHIMAVLRDVDALWRERLSQHERLMVKRGMRRVRDRMMRAERARRGT